MGHINFCNRELLAFPWRRFWYFWIFELLCLVFVIRAILNYQGARSYTVYDSLYTIYYVVSYFLGPWRIQQGSLLVPSGPCWCLLGLRLAGSDAFLCLWLALPTLAGLLLALCLSCSVFSRQLPYCVCYVHALGSIQVLTSIDISCVVRADLFYKFCTHALF